jgi:hypothetical protein
VISQKTHRCRYTSQSHGQYPRDPADSPGSPASETEEAGYGRGSVSRQGGAYVDTYKRFETGRPVRRSFATDPEAQVFLNEWYAEKQRRSLWTQRGGERSAGMVPAPVPAQVAFAELIDGWRVQVRGGPRHDLAQLRARAARSGVLPGRPPRRRSLRDSLREVPPSPRAGA